MSDALYRRTSPEGREFAGADLGELLLTVVETICRAATGDWEMLPGPLPVPLVTLFVELVVNTEPATNCR